MKDILMFLQACCCSGAGIMACRPLFHWFQLESYQFPGYFRTLKRQGFRSLEAGTLMTLVSVSLTAFDWKLFFQLPEWLRAFIFGAGLLCAGYGLHTRSKRQKAKKKLVYTPRMKRLNAVYFVVWSLTLFVVFHLLKDCGILGRGLTLAVFYLLLPLTAAFAGLLAWPIEKGISELYFRDAQRILRNHPDLIKIGITGSWGKTSVKFILGTLLSEKYPTLVTPASFNTPMGVTKVIRTQLEPGHRIFVAEMGARHVGDIREMCRLVNPKIGILTSVGPQHLDTFHTQDRITRTKYELIDAIPTDGSCFFADDDGIVLRLWEKTKKPKTLAGMNAGRDDVWAENLSMTPLGSRFDLCTPGEKVPCETKMLGELNIKNIILCASVCLKLGMTGKEISRGIRNLMPVEHRLELRQNPGGIHVLDDAFNSNIRGAEQAFKVLKKFPGKRIVVTPGMVELGEREAEMNREFGRIMAECCDEAILIGKKRSVAIREGLEEAGLDPSHIQVANNLEEAAEILREIAHNGDSVLFENDLPDNYTEE